VVGRSYFTRQATTLLKFAKSTNNPELAAVLIERAADLKSQVDETMPVTDPSPPGAGCGIGWLIRPHLK
jgi:hypothetical protein